MTTEDETYKDYKDNSFYYFPNTGTTSISTYPPTYAFPAAIPSRETVVRSPFLLSYYDSGMGRYVYLRIETSEEALEKARALMATPGCTQVEIFELGHRWETEWVKK